VAWGSVPIWGLTRNRSLPAYQRNPERVPDAPTGLDSASAAVDPTFTMLRVDLRDPADSVFRPAAALSVFAIHGTGNAPDNDLYDGDIHALVERAVERHIDSLTPSARRSRAVHLFANGAEGDVSPDWPQESRCLRARLHPVRMHDGSRAPSGWEWLAPAPASSDRCRAVARAAVVAIGDSLGRRAIALFDALSPQAASSGLLVTRAFRTLPLVGPDAPPGLCAEPLAGASTVAGAEDSPTRFHGWRWLGLFPSAFREGGQAARSRPEGCQAEKRPAVPGIAKRIFLGPHPLPEAMQLMVVRIGGLVFAAVPAEVTTITGRRVADSVRAAAALAGAPAEHVVVVGLANGFIQYVATEEEYHAQHYEGGSTLYGPATAGVLARELAALTASMGGPTPTSPPVAPVPITLYPGAPRALLPPRGSGPQRIERAWLRHDCGDGAIVAEWRDAPPGDVFPTSGFLLRFERLSGEAETGEAVAQDDGPDVEVRALGPMRGGSWRWQARWRAPAPGRYRLVLEERGTIPELPGPACDVGGVSGR
jgi:neutral ceramidase